MSSSGSRATLEGDGEHTQTRLSRLETLQQVSRALSREIVLDKLLVTVMKQVTWAMGADRSSLFLLDRDRNELWSQVAQGVEPLRFPANRGLAGHVVQTGEILNIPDAYEDDRFNPDIDRKTGYRTRSMLVMPIRRREGEVMGVVQVINKIAGTPFDDEDEDLLDALTSQISIAVDNATVYTELKEFFESFMESLADTIDRRHPLTAGHSKRVRDYCMAIARTMDYDEESLELLNYAALLHDYGKIAIPDSVLKKPGRLTDDEYKTMKTHPAHTQELLEKIKLRGRFEKIAEVAGGHHERMDGKGYPHGLKGEEIHPLSRVMAVADVFDALTSMRDYRSGMPVAKAVSILEEGKGTHFDPACVEAFIRWIDENGIAERIDAANAAIESNLPSDA